MRVYGSPQSSIDLFKNVKRSKDTIILNCNDASEENLDVSKYENDGAFPSKIILYPSQIRSYTCQIRRNSSRYNNLFGALSLTESARQAKDDVTASFFSSLQSNKHSELSISFVVGSAANGKQEF